MPRESTIVIGSGLTPHLQRSPAHDLDEGVFPIPSHDDQVQTLTGSNAVITNPENFSVSINVRNKNVTVGAVAQSLTPAPLEYRRALVIHNNGNGTLYIGDENVTAANGLPLEAGEKIAFDIQGTPGVAIYGVSASSSDVRILELA